MHANETTTIAGLESIGGDMVKGIVEAGSEFAGSVGRMFQPSDRSVFSATRNRISAMFAENRPKALATPPLEAAIATWLNSNNYMALGEITVFAPRGLNVTFAEYLDVLNELVVRANEIEGKVIKPVNDFFSTYINNPSMVRGISPRKVDSTMLYESIDPLGLKLAGCFDKNGRSDQIKFKVAYARVADVADVNKRMQALEILSRIPGPEKVEKSVLALVDRIEQFTRLTNGDKDFPEVSAAVVKDMATIVRRAALWIEFYAVVQRQVMVMGAALADTSKKLKEISKRK